MENKEIIAAIVQRQKNFQKMVGINLETIVEEERNALAEMYCYKGIEEFVELRKTFPSVLNKAAKNQPHVDLQLVKREWVDVLLFWINVGLVWQFTEQEIEDAIKEVQLNNFQKYKEKQMAKLNHEILRSPTQKVGIGGGNLTPKFIFVGQNPAQTITRGATFYSEEERVKGGSGEYLLKTIDELGCRHKSYFTNLVKEATHRNTIPPLDMILFWKPFFDREIEILSWNNKKFHIIPIGSVAAKVLGLPGIKHPSYVMRGGITEEAYKDHIYSFLGGLTDGEG